MSYDLDVIYVISLGLLVGLVTIPVRDWTDKQLATRNLKVHSFLWGWVAMLLSMAAVVPVLIVKGAEFNWRLLLAAYTEGLPVGAVAIVAYDLGIKPMRKFGGLLARAISRWILTSVDKTGGMYGGSYNGPGYPGELGGLGEEGSGPREDGSGLGEEELADVSCDPARGGPGGLHRDEQGGPPEGPP